MKDKIKKKILITGGCGFIGVNLLEYLLANTNWQINVLDNLSASSLENFNQVTSSFTKRVVFLKGDIRNKNDVNKAIAGCDLVVNLAAQTGVIPSQKNPLEDAEINVMGLINLLEASCQGVKRLIHASSAAPLGDQEMPMHEKRVPQPLSPYGASKLAGEAYCSAFAGSYGLNTVILRFSNVYGPFSGSKGSVIPKFVKSILEKRPVVIYGDGEQTRDFVYVQDICQAIYLALVKEISSNFELFQLGTGQETSIINLFKLIEAEFKGRGYTVKEPVYHKERAGEIRKNYADIKKAKEILSYQPQTELKNGLAKTIDQYLQSLS